MKTTLNKLRISTGFATLSADECAELVAHIEAVTALPEKWREMAISIATPAAMMGLLGHDTEQVGKGLYYCATDLQKAISTEAA